MIRPDDSCLSESQIVTIRRHADRLLQDASAVGRFPTPVDDLMVAAKLVVVDDEVLNESFIKQLARKTRAGLASIKSAFSKVLGLFDANGRLVFIDPQTPKPRVPFVKLHEAGHGSLPHQSKAYKLVHDCAMTLNADTTDLFEREANVFASEVLFQGEVFSAEAHDQSFSIKVPMKLAKKYGASNYATFRRYVTTNPNACCVVVLEPSVYDLEGGFSATVRRVVASNSFQQIYEGKVLCRTVDSTHPLASVVPREGRHMCAKHEIVLIDRNHEQRICTAESFKTPYQTFLLLRDLGRYTGTGIIVPAFQKSLTRFRRI
jgi:IrrE N-terminal-like domain